MVGKARVKKIRTVDELYHMVYSQSFLGNELEVLDAACGYHGVQYKLFYNYEEIASNCYSDDPYMIVTTDAPNEIINLHLCTELAEAIYIPQHVRSPKLEKRLDQWLGLAEGIIEPNPWENEPNSIMDILDNVEDEYKVNNYVFYSSP